MRPGSGDPELARPQPGWLGLLALGLVLALCALAWLQTQHFGTLRAARPGSDEAGALAPAQAAARQLRLRDALRLSARATQPDATPEARSAAAVELPRRYAEWRDSATRLQGAATLRLLGDDADFVALLGRIETVTRRADLLLAVGATPAADELDALQATLQQLDAPLDAATQAAGRAQLALAEASSQQALVHARLALLLTASLGLLALVFAATAMQQLRRLRERALELAGSNARLRDAQRQSEAQSRARSGFLAGLSHEIRTPLHALLGMLSLLREAGLTPRQVDHLRTASTSAEQLQSLLGDVLDMAQLDSGQLMLVPAATALRDLLREIDLQMQPLAAAKALALRVDADPGVPAHALLDARRVRQIVVGLITNAVAFSERGAVMLDVRCSGSGVSGAPTAPAMAMSNESTRLEFIVTDTGVGIDAEVQARLFDRLQAVGAPRQLRHGSSGLGLEIARSLARLMGGDIVLRSQRGAGSSFTFWLPLRRPDAADGSGVAPLAPRFAPALAPSVAAAAPAVWHASMPRAARPLQVLVAEDNVMNRQYLAALLEALGHDAHFTGNGEEAVNALSVAGGRRFDVVLMDLHMPVLDGVEAARAIRAFDDPSRRTVPIVVLTADAFPETQERCFAAGINDYLVKPVSPQGLAACLRRLFGSAALAGENGAGGSGRADGGHPAQDEPEPLFDIGALSVASIATSPEQVEQAIVEHLAQAAQTVQRLRAAVRDAQSNAMREHARAAQVAASKLGLVGLAATAQALQAGAVHLLAHEIAHLVQRFETQIESTRHALPRALEEARVARDAGRGQTITGSGSSRMPKRP